MFLNRADPPPGPARLDFRPYDLTVVRREQIKPEHFTISAAWTRRCLLLYTALAICRPRLEAAAPAVGAVRGFSSQLGNLSLSMLECRINESNAPPKVYRP
jgi:hypothetical protein